MNTEMSPMPAAPQVTESTRETLAANYARDGYAVIRGFFNADQTAAMVAEIERYVLEDLPHLPAEAAFYEDKSDPNTLFRLDSMDVHSKWAASMLTGDTIQPLASELFGEPAKAHAANLFGKAPRVGKETPAHQDGFYFMTKPCIAATFWLPLDPVDEENGCIRYVVGSHNDGLRPHGPSELFGFSLGLLDFDDNDRVREVAIAAQPGDLIVHGGLTVHRADPNPSDRRRWALGLVYWGQSAKVDAQRRDAHDLAVKAKWKLNKKL